ncbi:MAG: exodeoxyribonuclease VII large subunit [Clostridia bacterium]|nr:exodeoxyribonuclease VII large subunit [Clostridia bacterium]
MQRKLTVSQLNKYIGGVFEDERVLHNVVVCGEVFEYKKSGARSFITLKEGDCTLQAVSFSALAIEEGMSVEALGTVTFYAKTGRVSFIAESVTPTGEGRLYLEFLKLKERLKNEGLFENRPPLPEKISKIAVITSAQGAVLHDILSVVKTKNPLLDVCVCDVRVQGADSAPSIAEAIRNVNSLVNVDAIIIARGGGSAEDLKAYNTELVAREVWASRAPIISAVGHETDYTLCDLCASARAGTPSIAADMVCVPVLKKIARVRSLAKAIETAVMSKLDGIRNRIIYRAMSVMRHSEITVRQRADKIIELIKAMYGKLEYKQKNLNDKLSYLSAMMDKSSPFRVLAQGYAKITKDGKEVYSAKQLLAGDDISVRMVDGKINAKVV